MEHVKRYILTMIVTVSLIVFLVGFSGCSGYSGIKVGSFSSEYLNSLDYESAVKEVQSYFKSFEGCTMKRIDYAGDDAVKAEALARDLNTNEIIVLTSMFTSDREDPKNGLEPNKTYKDYIWILTRETYVGIWEVVDHGYVLEK